jgi:hypothetical protein
MRITAFQDPRTALQYLKYYPDAGQMVRAGAGVARGILATVAAASSGLFVSAVPAGSQNFPLHASDVVLDAPKLGPWGFDLDGMDRRVRPGDDFFSYASGRAYGAIEVPADRTRFGSLDSLILLSEHRVHALIAKAVSERQVPGSNAAKIARLYSGYLDRAAVEAQGLSPIRPELDRIRAARAATALVGTAAARCGGWTRRRESRSCSRGTFRASPAWRSGAGSSTQSPSMPPRPSVAAESSGASKYMRKDRGSERRSLPLPLASA